MEALTLQCTKLWFRKSQQRSKWQRKTHATGVLQGTAGPVLFRRFKGFAQFASEPHSRYLNAGPIHALVKHPMVAGMNGLPAPQAGEDRGLLTSLGQSESSKQQAACGGKGLASKHAVCSPLWAKVNPQSSKQHVVARG